ncbi:MAG TPA: DUF885 family protein, partial [Alphaproteobacteria bacterium]|nr:DUF885 family protein [Alphaproteobacteria bacterium]
MLSRRDLLVTTAAFATLSTLPAAAAQPGLKAALDAASEGMMADYPENATFLGLDTGPRAPLRGKLTDRSEAGDAARAAACADRLKMLKTVDASGLQGIDRINLETVIYAHQLADDGYRRFKFGDNAVLNVWQGESNTAYAVSQASGFFATIPDFLNSMHPVDSSGDAEDYLSRLSALARNMDAENARLTRDAALGAIAPDFLLDTTLKQMADFQAKPVADWGLVASLTTRAKAKNITGDWAGRAAQICTAEVGPAVARQIAVLKDLRAKATSDAGVWKLKDGDAFYDWALKIGTTTPMTPDEVHKLGLEQVKALTDRMDGLLRKQGLTDGTVGQRMAALGKDPRYLFPNTDQGRADLLAYLNGVVAKMRERLPRAFATIKKADLVIKRVPPDIEAGAPDGYEQDGPIDGSRPAS